MREIIKIKQWLRNIFVTKYVITRREILAWMIFRKGEKQGLAKVLGQTQLLVSKDDDLKQSGFSISIKHAKKLNRLQAALCLRRLEKVNENKYVYEIIAADKAVFITDLTGLTEN